jgi:hypothetical protein
MFHPISSHSDEFNIPNPVLALAFSLLVPFHPQLSHQTDQKHILFFYRNPSPMRHSSCFLFLLIRNVDISLSSSRLLTFATIVYSANPQAFSFVLPRIARSSLVRACRLRKGTFLFIPLSTLGPPDTRTEEPCTGPSLWNTPPHACDLFTLE